MEPLGPSPALVAALTEVTRVEALQGRSEPAIAVAERALALAEELGLPRPARALGYRGEARARLGDRGGLQDYREAIELATAAGQGREVALLYNNLGVDLRSFEGPAASLEILHGGIAYSRGRGLNETVDETTAGTLDVLVDTGELEQVLEVAAALVPRMDASGDVWNLVETRGAQFRIFALRGQAAQVAEQLDSFESLARELGDPDSVVVGLGSAALARAELGQSEAAAELITEVEASGTRADSYPVVLPAMVRTALGIGDPPLAERLVRGLQPRTPYAEHALAAANSALTEARGDLQAAADAYADAANRWERFGVVPEQAFALLGQGRCPRRPVPTDRGRALPARRPRDLRAPRRSAGARRDRRAPERATALSS